MRVGLVVYDGLDGTSGGFLYDRRVVQGLRDRGHAVTTVAVPRRSYTRNLLDSVSQSVWRQLTALADNVDIILEDELCHPSLVGPNLRLRRRESSPPIVSIVHHLRSSEDWSPLRTRVYRTVERAYLLTADAFVYNSHTTRETVESLIGPTTGVLAPPGRDHLQPAVTREQIRARAHNEGPVELLFVGSIVERKGLETLLKGLAALELPWSLTIVGDTTIDRAYTEQLQSLVKQLAVGDRVTMTGRVPQSRLNELYEQCQILTVPSQYEGYGIVYLEAMGHGLPAVGTRAGGASEVINDGTTGALITPGDVSALTNAVARLAADRDRLAAHALAARAAFDDHHTWDETAGAVATFLRRQRHPHPHRYRHRRPVRNSDGDSNSVCLFNPASLSVCDRA
ncbi:MAG: glycosyltransferase [halophilic archaeon J07HX5]|jgi:Glycosyltransferase|nr:MAG: glycosyltransferase [halophilic archaeon J07HX5]